MWTGNDYIQAVLIALAFFVLEFYEVPNPFSFYDSDHYVLKHFWEAMGFTSVAIIAMDAWSHWQTRPPKSRERRKD